jgi:tetratricopeptide (TPR) repeat protein
MTPSLVYRYGTAAVISVFLSLASGCDKPATSRSTTAARRPQALPAQPDKPALATLQPVATSAVIRASAEIEALPPVDDDCGPLLPPPVNAETPPPQTPDLTPAEPVERQSVDTKLQGTTVEKPSPSLPSVLRKTNEPIPATNVLHDESTVLPPAAHPPAAQTIAAPPNHLDETGILAWGASTPSPELFAVARQADAHVAKGIQLAERGASFTARAQFLQALRLCADALDQQRETTAHRRALSAGLAALDEAKSFLGPAGGVATSLTVAEIVAGHQTPLLKRADDVTGLTPADAMQRYFTYAQEQLASAGGDLAPAASALYALGKLEMLSLPVGAPTIGSIQSARAVVYFQAALVIQPQHALAANELGVLLARHGRLRDAKAVLQHSVRVNAEPSALRNLAVVHAELGEHSLAQQAEQQSQHLAAQSPAAAGATAATGVQWIDPNAFASTSQVAGRSSSIPPPVLTDATEAETEESADELAEESAEVEAPRTAFQRLTTWLPWAGSQR